MLFRGPFVVPTAQQQRLVSALRCALCAVRPVATLARRAFWCRANSVARCNNERSSASFTARQRQGAAGRPESCCRCEQNMHVRNRATQ